MMTHRIVGGDLLVEPERIGGRRQERHPPQPECQVLHDGGDEVMTLMKVCVFVSQNRFGLVVGE